MKIINGLVMVLSITQILSAYDFTLDVGSQQTVLSGETIDLNGKVLSGDKSKIDHYQWEENGKVLKNTSGDEIIYEDDANAENGYAPKGKGKHILKFVVFEESGQRHVKHLVVEVDKKENVRINKVKDMTFDIRAEFPVKREQRPEGNYRLSEGHYLDVKVGDIVPLSGIIDASKKSLVDFYTWESHGKILKNQLNDEIQYWDEENRENDYVPQKVGNEFLYFVVTDINGVKHSKTLLLKVKSKDANQDDHGNTMATATTIELNKKINALFETNDDNDFFKFTLDKKQDVTIVFYQRGTRKVSSVLTEEGDVIKMNYRSVPGSPYFRSKPTTLEAGTYYVNLKFRFGQYSVEVQTQK